MKNQFKVHSHPTNKNKNISTLTNAPPHSQRTIKPRGYCLKSQRRARYGQGSSMFQESMSGLMVWSHLSVCQRYENRLKKKNRNRLRKNRMPSVKENNPIPKEKHCLEPLKDKTKVDKIAKNECNRAYKSSSMQVRNDAIQGGMMRNRPSKEMTILYMSP